MKTSYNRGAVPAIAIVLILVALGIGGYIYENKTGSATPDNALARSLEHLSTTKSFLFRGEGFGAMKRDIVFGTGKEAKGRATSSPSALAFTGAVDLEKMAFGIILGVEVHDVTPYTITMEMRKVGTTTYFRLAETPKHLAFLSGQWVKFDLEDAGKKFGSESSAAKVRDLDAAGFKNLLNDVRTYKVLKAIGELPEEDVEGVMTRHIQFVFNKQAVEKMAREKYAKAPPEKVDEEKLQSSLAELDRYAGDIWIGKEDLTIRKVELRSLARGEGVPERTVGTIFFNKFNEPTPIEAPPSAMTYEEILRSVLGKLFPSANITFN